MPLQVATESLSAIAQALTSEASASQPAFLVVYASLTTGGRSWCGDCRKAEPLVEKIFASKPHTVRVAYAGQQGE
jgi:thiol-disulfide isomerase/thioredoxin